VAPVCFDAACHAASDEAFAATVALPMLLAAAAAAYVTRPVSDSLKSSGKVFEDPDTGVVFETPKDRRPLRDKKVSWRDARYAALDSYCCLQY
jgi:hypothetical protein